MDDTWIRAVGDDDYVASVKYEQQRKELSENLQTCLKRLMSEAFSENPEPGLVTDTLLQQAVSPFSNSLECILSHGLRAKVERSRVGIKVSFWHFLENIEKVVPQSTKLISKLRGLIKVKSANGKGRAWIRLALNENVLENHLGALLHNQELTNTWYEPHAFLTNHSYSSFFYYFFSGIE